MQNEGQSRTFRVSCRFRFNIRFSFFSFTAA